MTTIHMTYTGSCVVAGSHLMCSSMSASLDQKALFFDHIVGLTDSISGAKKGPGQSVVQKKVYRYSPAIAKASISGPLTDSGDFSGILDAAVHGDDIEVKLTFWKTGASATVSRAKITSLSLDVKAGDVANYSIEVTGAEYSFDGGGSASEAQCSKLITWSACSVNASTVTHDISSFSVNISNPPVPIYTTGWGDDPESGGMMPQKIRLGIQEVTGSIGVYGPSKISMPSNGTVSFNFGGVGKSMRVVFISPKDEGSGGPYVRTILFTGVSDGSVWS